MPDNAKYDLDAVTRRGDIDNLFGSPMERRELDRGGSIRGNNGGPKVILETQRGTMTVTRGGSMSSRMEGPEAPKAPNAPEAPKPPTVVER